MCVSLTPTCLTENPGQTDEQHDTPDIQHASHLQNRRLQCYQIVHLSLFCVTIYSREQLFCSLPATESHDCPRSRS